jgi:hypothetical protein
VVDDGSNEWEVFSSSDNGETWSFLTDFGAGSVGALPDYAQLGDDAFLTNGVIAPQFDDGSSLVNAGATQSPTITSSAGSAGSLLGTFRWKLVSMVGGTRQAGSAPSTSLALENKQGSLTWTQDANSSVTGYELYRTTGTGLVYYFVTYIDLRATTSFTDNVPDIIILENRLMAEHGDAPPTVYLVESHQQRMWWGRTDTDARKVYYSDVGDPDSVYDENNLDLTDADSMGDIMRAMVGGFEAALIVFHERSVWSVSGTGQVIGDIADWSIVRTNARIGTVSSRAVQRVAAGAIYTDQKGAFQTTSVATLAYFTPFGDIRLFDGDNDVPIHFPVSTTLADLNFSSRGAVISFTDPVRSEVGWIFPTGSSGTPDTAVVWNTAFGVWYVRSPQPFLSILSTDFTAEGEVLLAGEAATSVGGLVYQLWSGSTFNGTPIEVQWMTKTLYGADNDGRPDLSARKRWRWIDLLTQESTGVTFTMEWLQGNVPDTAASIGSTSVTPGSSTILSADGPTLVSKDTSDLTVALDSDIIRILLLDSNGDYLHHEGIRLRLSATADQGQWALEGFIIAYQPLPGLMRRVTT